MATKEEFDQAKAELSAEIENERQEVRDAMAAMDARIADLEARLAAGGEVTIDDLRGFRDDVRNIHTPPAPEEPQA